MVYRVSYVVGSSYEGTVEIVAGEDAEDDEVIAKAKRRLFRGVPPPPHYHQSFKVER